jgi:hypothetical protein
MAYATPADMEILSNSNAVFVYDRIFQNFFNGSRFFEECLRK